MNTRVKVVAAAIAAVLVLIVASILWFGMIGYNSTHEYQVYQSVTGNVQIIDNSGYYWKGFGTVWTYPRAIQAYYSQHPDEGGVKDWSVKVTFNDGGTAQISTFVKVQLPITHDERLALHCDFNANPKNILDAVRSHLVNCVKASGPMMSASENQASRKAEFNQIVEEQLVAGLFEMRRTEVELSDTAQMETTGVTPDGKPVIHEKKARVQATEIVRDAKTGKPIIVQDSPLARYKIAILQFSVTETTYDDVTLQQFAAKKESYLAAEQAKAKRQEEYQQRLMVTEKGLRQVAEIEAQMNQEKKKATISAEQKREVATIEKDQAVIIAVQKVEVAIKTKVEAETLREIASIKAATAELDKKATISAAEAKQKEIELGGGLAEKDRILATIKADRDAKVAVALAGVKTPGVVIIGGQDGKGTGLTETLMNLLLLKATGVLPEQQK
jgi:hypothetical protein